MKILTTCSNPSTYGHQQLLRSLNKFGYEYDVVVRPFQFGRQMQIIYEWCKQNPNEVFLYTDAYDTMALGDSYELEDKLRSFCCEMLVSAEKGCYPLIELKDQYPVTDYEWRFVNAGNWLTKASFFIEIYEDGLHEIEKNDQAWLSKQFLKRDSIHIDSECKIFQSAAFEGAEDFSYEGERLINNKTKQKPIFLHGNGGTSMDKFWDLLK